MFYTVCLSPEQIEFIMGASAALVDFLNFHRLNYISFLPLALKTIEKFPYAILVQNQMLFSV